MIEIEPNTMIDDANESERKWMRVLVKALDALCNAFLFTDGKNCVCWLKDMQIVERYI